MALTQEPRRMATKGRFFTFFFDFPATSSSGDGGFIFLSLLLIYIHGNTVSIRFRQERFCFSLSPWWQLKEIEGTFKH
jgi:hypothetical protein